MLYVSAEVHHCGLSLLLLFIVFLRCYQFATVALNIWSTISFTISVTSCSCTDARLCVVSYDDVAVKLRSKSSAWFWLLVKRTLTVIDSSVCAEYPSADT